MNGDFFDLLVIGAGPGGYVAAIRASQLGMKVAVIEERASLGGVCLNEGCIPSKALLDSSELFAMARDRFPLHGIEIDPPRLNLSAMMKRKNDVVRKLTDGIAYLFKKHDVSPVKGFARVMPPDADGSHSVQVTSEDGVKTIKSRRVIIATGSEAATLPGIQFDGDRIVSAREALSFEAVPEHLVIAGGGYIGLEMASVWVRLGAKVTVMEMLPQIVPNMDRQVSDALYRSLRKQGITFKLGTRINSVRKVGSSLIVQFNPGTGSEEIDCDRMLVAVGRRPRTDGIGLREAGVSMDDTGRITVNKQYESSVPGLFAIGDVIHGPMLAHKAMEEATAVVECMAGHNATVEYGLIPGVVYTWPEGACIGSTEEHLKESSIPYRTGRFQFMANGRARCMDEQEGFVKVLAHSETDRLLGVHIVGPRASDLIAEAVTVMSFGGTSRDIALICHAHPSLSEALKEAALDVHKASPHA